MPLKPHQFWTSACLVAMIALAWVGLTGPAQESAKTSQHAPPPTSARSVSAASLPVADLSEIRFRRKFRILVPAEVLANKLDDPPNSAAQRHVALIEQFAEEQFLLPIWVAVPRWQDLTPALDAGRGDLIGAHMQIRELRERNTPFTVPVADITEVLVARVGDNIRTAADLDGREIALSARSSFWPQLLQLQRQAPNMTVRIIDTSKDPVSVLSRLVNMELDMAVLDIGKRELGVAPWQALQAITRFSSTTHLAFGMHEENVELKRAMNEFLAREQLVHRNSPARTDDLEKISKRGVLRVLTRNNEAGYFIWRGRPLGFEYELLRRFADQQKLSLEMILAPTREHLLSALRQGAGDVVATSFVSTPDVEVPDIRLTRPYREIQQYLLTRSDDTSLQSVANLAGRTITLRRSSPSWPRIRQLIGQGLKVKTETVSDDVETEELIAGVATGLYDTTITNTFSVNAALSWRDDVRAAFALHDPVPVSWAVRHNNPQLLEALNDFLDKEYKQVFYNVIHARYFENPRLQRARISDRRRKTVDFAPVSPYDDIVRRLAKKHGFDWTLIVAMMFRESRFDPNAVSWAGAKGLMQVLPVTAQRFGVHDLDDPTASIIAGVRMLAWLYRKFEDDLSVKDRTWFTLAAYNAGLGHLHDARRLARELNLDPNRWFDNVETAMRLLTRPKYYRKSRHGYVRGIEPVTYVRDIRELYNAYKGMQKP